MTKRAFRVNQLPRPTSTREFCPSTTIVFLDPAGRILSDTRVQDIAAISDDINEPLFHFFFVGHER